jgi:hypothetical protein
MITRLAIATLLAGCWSMRPPIPPWVDDSTPESLEAGRADDFIQRLSTKYRGMTFYRDQIVVREMTEREGTPSTLTETRMECVVDEGKLEVATAASQVSNAVLPAARVRLTPLLKDLLAKRSLWRAPHLGLAFCDRTLKDFRVGVDGGFSATAVTPVTVNDRDLMKVELRGAASDGGRRAVFGLFVNPNSMLIERVEGEQPLADGSTYRTTVDITPISVIEPPETAVRADEEKVTEPLEPSVLTEPLKFGETPLL